MVQVFRILVILSVVALGAALVLPLQHAVQIRVDLSAPPAMVFVAPVALLLGVAMLVAAVALLLFRRWGRWLGAVALVVGVALAGLALVQGAGTILATAAQVLLVLSGLAWLGCLLVSRHPSVAVRFQHAP